MRSVRVKGKGGGMYVWWGRSKKKGRGYTTEIEGDGGKKMGKEGILRVVKKEMNFRGNNKK